MLYYFKVTFDNGRYTNILVKAKNVIEAGEKAMAFKLAYRDSAGVIVEIIRTDIEAVIVD